MIKRWGIILGVSILLGSVPSWAQEIQKKTLADGSVYEGQLKDGVFNGKGTLNYANGQQYTGEFKNGLYDGRGVLVYTDGSKYVGHFREGFLSGEGTITYADGTVYKGKFKDGDVDTSAPAPVAPHSPTASTSNPASTPAAAAQSQ